MPYDFTSDDFKKFSEDIIQADGDQATITTILADMQTTVFDAIGDSLNKAKELQKIQDENARLLKANMDLFLRTGTQKPEEKDKEVEDKKDLTTSDYMESYFNKIDKEAK